MFYHHIQEFHATSSSFWDSFFSELFAGLVILLIGSFTVPWYLDWRKKPHLSLINPATRNEVFNLTEASDGHWEATLNIVIKNKTNFTQREWFWHIMIPTELNPNLESLDPTVRAQVNDISIGEKSWKHYHGNSTNREIIFPNRTLKFNYEIKVKTTNKERKDYLIHYYFNTEFGSWPSKANQIELFLEKPEAEQLVVFSSREYLETISLKPE